MESDIYFLPSEIARLVLGYLKENDYTTTYKSFLKECPHLTEYTSMLKKGRHFPLTIMGISLIAMVQEYAELKLKATQDGQWSQPVAALWKQFESVVKALKQTTKTQSKQIRSELQSSRTRKAILSNRLKALPHEHIQSEQDVHLPTDLTESENQCDPTPVTCVTQSNTSTPAQTVSTYSLRSRGSVGTCGSNSPKDRKSRANSSNLSSSDDSSPLNTNNNNADNIDEYGEANFSSDVNFFSKDTKKGTSTKVCLRDAFPSTVLQSEVINIGNESVMNRENTAGLDYLINENMCHSSPVLQRKTTEMQTRKTTSPLTSPIEKTPDIPLPSINLFSSSTTCFGSLQTESDNHTTPRKCRPNMNETHVEQTISPWSPSAKSPRRKRHPPRKWRDDVSATISKPVMDPSSHQSHTEELNTAETTNTSLALPKLFEKILNDTKLHEKLAETINVRFLEGKSSHNISSLQEETKTKPLEYAVPSIISEDTMDRILNKPVAMSEETIDGIIHMATTDPIFDNLFKTFETDKNDYLTREYGRSVTEENTRVIAEQQVNRNNIHVSGENASMDTCAVDVHSVGVHVCHNATTCTENAAVTTLQRSAPSPGSLSGDSKTSTVSSFNSVGQTFKKKPRRIKPTPCAPLSAGFSLESPQSPWSVTTGSVPSPAFAQATEHVIPRSPAVIPTSTVEQPTYTATGNQISTIQQSASTAIVNQISTIQQSPCTAIANQISTIAQSPCTATGNQISTIQQSPCTAIANQISTIQQSPYTTIANQISTITQPSCTATGNQISTSGKCSENLPTGSKTDLIGQCSQSLVTANQTSTVGQYSQSIVTRNQASTVGQCSLASSTKHSPSRNNVRQNSHIISSPADASAVVSEIIDHTQYSCDIGPSDTGPSDTGPSHIGPSHIGPSHIGPSHIGPSHILSEQSVGTGRACPNTVTTPPGVPLTSKLVRTDGQAVSVASMSGYFPGQLQCGQNENICAPLNSDTSQDITMVDTSRTDSSVRCKHTHSVNVSSVSQINSSYCAGSHQYISMPNIIHTDGNANLAKPTFAQSENVEGIPENNNTDVSYELCSIDNVAFYQPVGTRSVSYGPSKTIINSPATSSESFLNHTTLPLVFSPSSSSMTPALDSLQTVTCLPGSILSGGLASQPAAAKHVKQKKTPTKKIRSQRKRSSKSKKTKTKQDELDDSYIPESSSSVLVEQASVSVQNSASDVNVVSVSTPQKAVDNALDFNHLLTLSPGGQTFMLSENYNWSADPMRVMTSAETPSKLNPSVLSSLELANYIQPSAESPTINQSVVLSSVTNSETGSIYLKITSPANSAAFKWPNILSRSAKKTPRRGQPSAVSDDGYFVSPEQSSMDSLSPKQESFIAVPICKKPDLITADSHIRSLSFDSFSPVKRISQRSLQTKGSPVTPIQKIRASSRLNNFCVRTMDFGVDEADVVMQHRKPRRKRVTMIKNIPPKKQYKPRDQVLELTVASPSGKKSTVMSFMDQEITQVKKGGKSVKKGGKSVKKGGKSVKTAAEKKQGVADSLPAKLPIKEPPKTKKAPRGSRAIKAKPPTTGKPKGRQKKTQSAKITDTLFAFKPTVTSQASNTAIKPASLPSNTAFTPTHISTESERQFTKLHQKTIVSNISSAGIGSLVASCSESIISQISSSVESQSRISQIGSCPQYHISQMPGRREEEAAWTLASFSTSNILADAMREADIRSEDRVLLDGVEAGVKERAMTTNNQHEDGVLLAGVEAGVKERAMTTNNQHGDGVLLAGVEAGVKERAMTTNNQHGDGVLLAGVEERAMTTNNQHGDGVLLAGVEERPMTTNNQHEDGVLLAGVKERAMTTNNQHEDGVLLAGVEAGVKERAMTTNNQHGDGVLLAGVEAGVKERAMTTNNQHGDGVLLAGVEERAMTTNNQHGDGVLLAGVEERPMTTNNQHGDGVLLAGVEERPMTTNNQHEDGVLLAGVEERAMTTNNQHEDGVLLAGVEERPMTTNNQHENGVLLAGDGERPMTTNNQHEDGVLLAGVEERIPTSSNQQSGVPEEGLCENDSVVVMSNDSVKKPSTTSNNPVKSISNNPMKPTSNNPVKSTSNNPVKPTSNNPVESTSNNPVNSTSNNPVKSTSNNPVKSTSNNPVKSTSNNPVKPTSNNPVKSTSNNPVNSTSNNPVKPTSNNPVKSTSNNPVKSTSNNPVKPTSNNPVKSISNNSVKPTSNNPVKSPSNNQIKPTSNSIIEATSNGGMEATSNSTVTPTSNCTVIPTSNSTVTPTSNSTVTHTSNNTVTPTSNSTVTPTSNSTVTHTSNSTVIPTSNSTITPTSTKISASKSKDQMKDQVSTTSTQSSVAQVDLKKRQSLTPIRKSVCPISLMGKLSVKAITKHSSPDGRMKSNVYDTVSKTPVNEKHAETIIEKSKSQVCSDNEKQPETTIEKYESSVCNVNEQVPESVFPKQLKRIVKDIKKTPKTIFPKPLSPLSGVGKKTDCSQSTSPGHRAKDSPGHSTKGTPGHHAKDSPGHRTKGTPGHRAKDSHGHSTKDSHGHSTKDSHGHSTKDSPGHRAKDSHGHSTKDSPGHRAKDSHGHSTKDSPGHRAKDSHGHSTKGTLGHSAKDSQGHSAKDSQGHSAKEKTCNGNSENMKKTNKTVAKPVNPASPMLGETSGTQSSPTFAASTPRSSKKRRLVEYSTDEGSMDSTSSCSRKKRKLDMKTASVEKLLSILHKFN